MLSVYAMPSHPLVQVDDNTFMGPGRSVRSLTVAASFDGNVDRAAHFAHEVADRVLDAGADLSPYEVLRIVVRRQAVTGIGYLSKNHIEAAPVAQWRERFGR